MAISLHKRRKVADFDPVRDGKTTHTTTGPTKRGQPTAIVFINEYLVQLIIRQRRDLLNSSQTEVSQRLDRS